MSKIVGNIVGNALDLSNLKTNGIADLSQNDPNGEGYVKNRTHYKETAGAVIFSESSLAFADTLGSFTMAELADSIELEEGKTYKVSWGGVDYACVAQKDPVIGNGLYLGNGRDINGTTSTEPFLIRTTKEGSYDSSSGKTEIRNYAQTYSIALEISGDEETIYHQLDPRYIPNMYYEEDGGAVEILPEMTIPVDPDDPMIPSNYEFDIAAGDILTVKWNGVKYVCTVQDISGAIGGMPGVALGDLSSMGLPSNGEPFMMAYSPEYMEEQGMSGFYGMIAVLDGSTSVTLSVTKGGKTIHHIPPRFIKDMYGEEEAELLPETALTFAEIDGVGMTTVENPPFVLEAGKTYTVIYNGTEYICVCDPDMLAIGNFGALSGGESTGEPFAITMADAGALGVISLNGETSATISIRGNVINKIKSKYIDFSDAVPVFDISEYGEGANIVLPEFALPIRSALEKGPVVFKVSLYDDKLMLLALSASYYGVSGEITACACNVRGNTIDSYLIKVSEHYLTISREKYRLDVSNTANTELYLKSSGNKQFKITVDDDGNLTATETTGR